ncbi:saccharopine dehydrogenase NADP-binding domain-containing protein [Parvibaculum sp.]|jgi:short subunit dehydrogenase-like uncharacterized protein|uniref:saccharopine dehydrogenase NADP-binding domain-containing protein n=1 Tax=Parvibaculum sp. TaxID=2024848 RepID=UPI000C5C7653|nr:saccharopine dehydrogenase NADP-binding domain-containing protein [Parvibaculum sp.]MAU62228.1 hypothetical protein [Parvibaculum sp.]MBO6667120.1 saccharopine dehydrogenase NADP-binding domain-containing protein [Parvibaculum sp.]MBO6692272.1 saccharopine dehydrogenase NADP-binding domain-containing protein [Parvibaculum sp.]MBO6713673.1 saccharopine dehydrogenase NADP-binding domain-containing protein [Parvibaculum sp.]|tara:strand:+ start:5295 stop:6437 length:1143 start_codon:yes stop_codon:yes gene_type:complete
MKSRILVYGVDGFMGALTSHAAAQAGLAHVAGGRAIAGVAQHASALAKRKGSALAEPRTFTPGNAERIAGQLDDVGVLVNCAPLEGEDLRSLTVACIATGTHLIDMSADRARVAALAAFDEAAAKEKTMLMAGAGFDFAAVDAVAMRLAQILPGARAVTLAVKRGSRTMEEAARLAAAMREEGETLKNGQFVPARAGERVIEVDFDEGPEKAYLAPWRGEAMAARHRGIYSTMETFEALPEKVARALEQGTMAHRFFRRGWGLKRLERRLAGGRLTPGKAELTKGHAVVWGEARHPDGRVRRARLVTPQTHVYSAEAAVLLARRALDAAKPGYQLPSAVAGAALVEEIPGVQWREIVERAEETVDEDGRPVTPQAEPEGA